MIPSPNIGRARPKLSPIQRYELGGASVANAIDLRKDAQLLVEAGRLQRAAFLLVSCVEEILKAHLCLRGEPADWAEFWSIFRDHERKLALLWEIEPEPPEDRDEAVKMLTHWRERCLYVEVSHPGNPQTPRGLVDPGGLDASSIEVWTHWADAQILRLLDRLKTKP